MAIRKKTKTTRPAPRRPAKAVKKPAAKKPAARPKQQSPKSDSAPRQEQPRAHQPHTGTPDYSQLFAQMGAPFLNMFQAAASTQSHDTQNMAQSWLDTQRQYWQTALSAMQAPPATPGVWPAFTPHPAAPHFSAFKGMGMGGGASGPGSAFADMLRGGRAFDPFDQLASLPGLGYLREKHEEFARLYKAWQAHEVAQQKYNAEMARIMLEALARFEASLASPAANQKPFASLKDVYAHWVNISEDVYAQFAASPAHTALYGEVVNTLSAVKREMTVVIDQWAAQMNLPTRAEVDSLHQRMHDMKRELRDMKRALRERKGGRR